MTEYNGFFAKKIFHFVTGIKGVGVARGKLENRGRPPNRGSLNGNQKIRRRPTKTKKYAVVRLE